MPRKSPKLTSTAERRRIAAGAKDLNYEPTLAVLGIAKGHRRYDQTRDMLEQIAAIYRVDEAVAGPVKAGNAREKGARSAGVEGTPAGQIALLEATKQLIEAQGARGEDPNPFFPHTCDVEKSQLAPLTPPMEPEEALARQNMELEKAIATQKPRHPAALPAALEMAIATSGARLSSQRIQR